MAGYPLATFGKLYGWDNVFLSFQIITVVKLVVHFCCRHLDRNMIDVNKIE